MPGSVIEKRDLLCNSDSRAYREIFAAYTAGTSIGASLEIARAHKDSAAVFVEYFTVTVCL